MFNEVCYVFEATDTIDKLIICGQWKIAILPPPCVLSDFSKFISATVVDAAPDSCLCEIELLVKVNVLILCFHAILSWWARPDLNQQLTRYERGILPLNYSPSVAFPPAPMPSGTDIMPVIQDML